MNHEVFFDDPNGELIIKKGSSIKQLGQFLAEIRSVYEKDSIS